MFRDPENTYPGSRLPDPGVKKAQDPQSGSVTLEKLLSYLSILAPTSHTSLYFFGQDRATFLTSSLISLMIN